MTPTTVHADPFDVRAALGRLGVTEAALRTAVFAGYSERTGCTANDAPIAPGFLQWNRTLRTLREQLIPLGWRASNEGQYATAVNEAGDLAIAVASGCPSTGLPRQLPTTRSRKGLSTLTAVGHNYEQLELPLPDAPFMFAREPGRVTWMLLFHVDDREIRAELSLPVHMDGDGHIDRWRERIMLARTPLDPAALPEPNPRVDRGAAVDVPVRRRA